MKIKSSTNYSRRDFIACGLKGILSASLPPLFLSTNVLGMNGNPGPNSRINLGAIGCGNQGGGELSIWANSIKTCQVRALCDPYKARREKALADKIPENDRSGITLYEDYRELLTNPEIDAVTIVTPDHWHVPIALEALRNGKHIYVAKPLGYTLNQNKTLLNAVEKSGRSFYYGTQQRGSDIIKKGISLVRSGAIGKIKRIEVWAPGGRSGGDAVEIPVPEGLNYELFTGPAPMRPCTECRIRNAYSTYFHSDFAIGFIAGWGAHPLDVMVWGMDSDISGPMTVEAMGKFPESGYLDTCISWDAQFTFKDGVTMRFMDHSLAKREIPYFTPAEIQNFSNGTTFFGEKDWISVGRHHLKSSDPSIIRRNVSPETFQLYAPQKEWYGGFIEVIQTGKKSYGPIDQAVRSDSISHVALMAVKAGKKITWDPIGYRFLDPQALNVYMEKPVRGSYYKA